MEAEAGGSSPLIHPKFYMTGCMRQDSVWPNTGFKGVYEVGWKRFGGFSDFFLRQIGKTQEMVLLAGMAKLVDAPDLGSGIERCEGSSPFPRTRETAALRGPCFFGWQ